MDNSKQQPEVTEQDSPQSEPKKKVSPRRRGVAKTLISENSKEVVVSIAHAQYKNEKISATIRRDKKFNPKQRQTDLGGRLL